MVCAGAASSLELPSFRSPRIRACRAWISQPRDPQGPPDSIKKYVIERGGLVPVEVDEAVQLVANSGATPLWWRPINAYWGRWAQGSSRAA